MELYKYRPYAPGGSKLGFLMEYAYSFLATARLTFKARRSGRFEVIQACNPPDIFWPIALVLRAIDRQPVRVRPSRPVPGALRVPFPRQARSSRTGGCCPGAQDSPGCRSRDRY